MNLRGRAAIKPPKRYDEELFMQPTPPPPSCNQPRGYNPDVGQSTFPSPFVDFNPDLPPAAFPTIDRQQPPNFVPVRSSSGTSPMQEHAGGSITSRENIVDGHHLANTNHDQEIGGDEDVAMLDAGYDFSENDPDELDYQACCDYVNYLNEFENNAEVVMRSMNLSDDENDVGIGAYEAAGMSGNPLREVKWSDISPILQTEIFENLRSVNGYRQAVEALRLSPSEQVKMIEHSSARKEQIQRENAKLNEMRTKQLRALLRVDNSYLRTQKVPGQLIFLNISKKCLHDTTTCSSTDYSMSQASDILIARKYLRGLGLDPKFAGEWSNKLVTITTTGGTAEDEDFEWTGELLTPEEANMSENGDMEFESSPGSESTHNDGSRSDCSPTPKRPRTLVPNLNAAQQILRHRLESSGSRGGMTRPLPFQGLNTVTESVQPLPSSRSFQNSLPQQSPLGRESVVRLRIGSQGAARIQQDIFGISADIVQAPSLPQTNVAINNTSSENPVPPLGFFRNRPLLNGTETPSQYRYQRPRSSNKGGCETLKRSLGGAWYYSKGREETEAASRASRVLREKLAVARAETSTVCQEVPACHGSTPSSPPVNLTISSLDNTYVINKNGLCECQSEGVRRREPLVGWTNGGNPQTPPNPEANIVPHHTSFSGHTETERNRPQYSPITPPHVEASCWPKDNQKDVRGFEGYATHVANSDSGPPILGTACLHGPNDAEVQGDVTTTSWSLPTNAEKLFSKHGSLNVAENSVPPVPELEMTEVNAESTVMEKDNAHEKRSPVSPEAAAPASPNMNTVLFCPKEQLPAPLNLETMEKPRKKKYRKCGNGWTKKKKPSSKPGESLTETVVQAPTKNAIKSSAPGVEAANSGRRRSERINKQAA